MRNVLARLRQIRLDGRQTLLALRCQSTDRPQFLDRILRCG